MISGRLGVSQEFLKFLLVGAAAFVVNQLALYVFYDSPLASAMPDKHAEIDFGLFAPESRLLIASALAVEVAIIFKFVWSEGWIFRHRRSEEGGAVSRFVHFNASCAASSILTVAVTNVVTPVFGISPYISTAVGVLCGFMLNWIWSARLVWPERRAAAAD